MSLPDAKGDQRLWSSIFLRRGSNGISTRLYDSLDASQSKFANGIASADEGEILVICHIGSADKWTILTTHRLIWSIHGARRDIKTSDILDATVDLKKNSALLKSKQSINMISIILRNKEIIEINAEPGKPLFGLLSVLRSIGKKNASRFY